MNTHVRFIVYRNHMIFDDVIVKLHDVLRNEECCKQFAQPIENDNTCTYNLMKPVRLCKRGLNSYLVSAYIATLSKSYIYRKNAIKMLKHFQIYDESLDTSIIRSQVLQIILIRLRMPKKQFLDYKWSEKLMQMIIERQEADNAMSWLSTLGGAFSALGEEFESCAKIAGKISVKQLELALRLDNPLLVARCRLYAALSLIQRGYFNIPKNMIRKIYKFAIKEKDVRLQNMCQGVWAKLQYNYKQYRRQKKSLLLKTLHISSKI